MLRSNKALEKSGLSDSNVELFPLIRTPKDTIPMPNAHARWAGRTMYDISTVHFIYPSFVDQST